MRFKTLLKYMTLFCIGTGSYFEIELNWRYFTNHLPVHWSMPILGGMLFILLGGLNNWFPWEMSLLKQCTIGMLVCTGAELLAGIVLNLWLGLNIWDYSHLPLNLWGQVCVAFVGAWFCLAFVAIIIDDCLRWKLFHEQKPHYTLL